MLAKATGLTFFRALSFSLFVYTGAGQMAAVTMLAQNVAYVIIIFTVFINKLYMSLTIFLYLLKCLQSLILSALRAFFSFVVNLTYLGLSSYIFAIKRG